VALPGPAELTITLRLSTLKSMRHLFDHSERASRSLLLRIVAVVLLAVVGKELDEVTDDRGHVVHIYDEQKGSENATLRNSTRYIHPVCFVLSDNNPLPPTGRKIANPIYNSGAETTCN